MTEQIEKRTHRVPHVEVFELSADELDAAEHGYSTRQNYLSFLGIVASIFVSFVVFALERGSSKDPTIAAIPSWHWGVIFATGLVVLLLFVQWRLEVKSSGSLFVRIRKRSVGPLGEEGAEIKPAALEALPPEPPEKQG